jgi:glycosyltransferase involved in cell wall biosynthesis
LTSGTGEDGIPSTMTLKFSIITPSFNQARFLERTITSVLEQPYPKFEYIIIDGGSNDSSREIIQKYQKKLAYWISEPDKGQTDAINKGFARATGDIFAWLNSDDTYMRGFLPQVASFFEKHPDAVAVYSNANFIDENDRIIGRFPAAQTDYKKLKQGYVHIPQQACFFRADLWRKVGPLDPNIFFAMDYDLWVRLSREGDLFYLPEFTWANFRLHSDAKTITADDRCWPEMVRIHRRDGGSFFSFIMLKYLIRILVGPIIRMRRRRMIERLETR